MYPARLWRFGVHVQSSMKSQAFFCGTSLLPLEELMPLIRLQLDPRYKVGVMGVDKAKSSIAVFRLAAYLDTGLAGEDAPDPFSYYGVIID
jgi:hypothetical protein